VAHEVALGIDVGTSGVRIVALDAALATRAMASASMAPPETSDGHIRQDAEVWWHATRAAFAQLDLGGLVVRALAVDGTSGTIVTVDGEGTPTGLASMYNDVASDAAVAAVAAAAPRETAALGRTSPLARALDLRRGDARLLHQADWIAGRLSGRFDVTDENNALKTGFDPRAREWPAWIETTGLRRNDLPRVIPAGTAIGSIHTETAAGLGLPADTVVVAGTTDGCAAFLASGARMPGDGVSSLGTTLTLKLLSATPVFAPAFGIYSHRLADTWLAGGASNSGGGVLASFFSREEIVSLSGQLQPDAPTGLDYYPLTMAGERFPINDPTLAPRLAPRPADDGRFLQGMLEGIAAIEAEGYRRLASLGASPLTTLRSVGGGSSNTAWTRIRQRALGAPFLPAMSDHAAVGTARLAWRGLGHAC
jgi:sugar (pentulose or hexulose) kinase